MFILQVNCSHFIPTFPLYSDVSLSKLIPSIVVQSNKFHIFSEHNQIVCQWLQHEYMSDTFIINTFLLKSINKSQYYSNDKW